MSLAFNPENKRYFEISEREKRDLLLSGGSLAKIKEDRMKKYGSIEPMNPEMVEVDLHLSNFDKTMRL